MTKCSRVRAVIFEEGGRVAYALYCVGERAEIDSSSSIFRRNAGSALGGSRLLLSDVFPQNACPFDVLYDNQGAKDFWKKLGFKEHCLTLEWWPEQGRGE